MIAVGFGQGISPARLTTVVCLVAGAVAVGLWLYPASTRPSRAGHSSHNPDKVQDAIEPEEGTGSRRRHGHPRKDQTESKGVVLRQVYPPPDNNIATDVDIIAIHGLDTRSPDTWIWDPKGTRVNWLEDPHMLPEQFPTARIFTCDWPAALFEQPDFVPKMFDEFARLLLAGIKSRPPATNDQPGRDRPIVFVASCLGGIILSKALVMASGEYESVKQATRGIVFLATPFRGTSFQHVAAWAEPGLRLWASIRDKNVSTLLELVKSTFNLGELVRSFTALCQGTELTGHVFVFYETGKSSLPRKIAPWLPDSLSQEQPLVDCASATLDIVSHPLPLERPHVTMNKFHGPDDPGFVSVAGVLKILLCDIRDGRPIERADLWIRNTCYSPAELKIERLSGDLLPMDRCYINLAIVEQLNSSSGGRGGAHTDSPFSLFARLNVETPDETIQVTLPTLFEPREARNGEERRPRRILIRGRAGVGKTTLCKKIVYEFTHGEEWRYLFDRVLWVPLRNLKRDERRLIAGYDMQHLFRHEYFSHPQGEALASALCQTLEATDSAKTLFILDGLDEVSQDLDGDMLRFLKKLLNQPNAIITSRPHAMLPPGLNPIQLELETIGFYPDQVEAYVEKAFANPETGELDLETPGKIQSYLRQHELVEGLVRIPVQLDALCCTWSSFNDKPVPQTMTAIYRAIEQSLWKKDIVRLGKQQPNGQQVTYDYAQDLFLSDIEDFVEAELSLVEGLAFTGLHNDVIDFRPDHRNAISKQFKTAGARIPLDTTCARLSFLRTSDPSPNARDRNYHFLHLTFQEYFAARYFVRQWKAKQPLSCLQLGDGDCNNIEPAAFLREHKYDPRYNIFWRFVAGLLDSERETINFFQTTEKEPRDLLGFVHQRLVMHCLSEVERKESAFTPLRAKLEGQMERWILFECDFHWDGPLAREMECPEQVLVNALEHGSEYAKGRLLDLIASRRSVPSSVIDLASRWLNDGGTSRSLYHAIFDLLGTQQDLPHTILQAIAAHLNAEGSTVRQGALWALGRQANLGEEMLQSIAARLKDEESSPVLCAALRTLEGQANLGEEMLQSIAARLKDKDEYVRQAALEVLQGRVNLTEEISQDIAAFLEEERKAEEVQEAPITQELPDQVLDHAEEIIQGIMARLKDGDWKVRYAAIKQLENQANLTEEILLQGIAPRLNDKDNDVRRAALDAFLNQEAVSLDVIGPYIKPFYEALLDQSTRDHIYWYSSNTSSFIGVGTRRVPVVSRQHFGMEAVVKLLSEKGPATVAVEDQNRWGAFYDGWEEALVELLQPKP